MAVRLYDDPELVAVYDLANPLGSEADLLLGLAGHSPQRILDVGCGSGRLATQFAALGHDVVGLEPSALMLDVAGSRPGGQEVTWTRGDAASFVLPIRFDLIVMAGHVFQVFLEDDEARTVLSRLRRHLASEGRLVFASRNPSAREWEQWTGSESVERFEAPSLGAFTMDWEVTSIDGPRITYLTHLTWADGRSRTGRDTIRFRSQSEIQQLLNDAGLAATNWYGEWDQRPMGESCSEIVVVAHAAAGTPHRSTHD